MSKNIIKFFVLLSLLFLNNNVFSNSGNFIHIGTGNIQTINELKGNLKDLKNEKDGLNYKLNILKGNKKLNSLFKKQLTILEISNIKNIVNKYKSLNIRLNTILVNKSKKLEDITDIRKKLIEERISFYKKLIIYIDKNKLKKYKSYVKSDTQILKDTKDVNAKINKSKEILKKKIEKIKIKIKKHDDIFNKELKILIEKKLEEKIQNLKNNNKFILLNNNRKKQVLLKTISKINIKIVKLTEQEEKVNIILKKIEIYKIAIYKLKQLYNEY